MTAADESNLQFERQLFHHEDAGIRVHIRLGFAGERLKLDGYDIGPTVKELRGDSDYEYAITLQGAGLEQLYRLSGLAPGRKRELVDHLAERFSLNEAFSLFRAYLLEKEIQFESFTWD